MTCAVCLRRYVCKQTFGDIQEFLKVRFVKLGEAHQVLGLGFRVKV